MKSKLNFKKNKATTSIERNEEIITSSKESYIQNKNVYSILFGYFIYLLFIIQF